MARLIFKSDAELKSEIEQELEWNPRVRETDIGVEVRDAVVTLTGTVDSWAARAAAQDAAHRVSGVMDVANNIIVKLPGSWLRTDADIAQAVRRTLEWDVFVPDEQIRSTVSHGVVTLEGSVDSWTEHDDAARAVAHLAGVREVKNLIEVNPPPVASQGLHVAIEEALTRHAEHAAKHIQISVVDGQVTLTGEIPSWGEYEAVVGAVKGTRGVRQIRDQLYVRS